VTYWFLWRVWPSRLVEEVCLHSSGQSKAVGLFSVVSRCRGIAQVITEEIPQPQWHSRVMSSYCVIWLFLRINPQIPPCVWVKKACLLIEHALQLNSLKSSFSLMCHRVCGQNVLQHICIVAVCLCVCVCVSEWYRLWTFFGLSHFSKLIV